MNLALIGLSSLLVIAAGVIVLLLRRMAATADAMRKHREELSLSFEAQRKLERVHAAADERDRIYSDLHDDIGAKLLDLVYGASTAEQADLARSVLQDLRDVVSRSKSTPGSLLDVLDEIHDEVRDRLARVNARLNWEQADGIPNAPLDQAQALHLFRIVREATTNAIRHAKVSTLRIRVQPHGGELFLDVTDDGPGLMPDRRSGAGSHTMVNRASKLHGSLQWDDGTRGGTKVLLRFPIPKTDGVCS